MYKIIGKQRFGAVWANGECVVMFNHGVAYTNDTAKADILRAKGYTVEGEPDEVETDSKEVRDDVGAAKETPSMDENPPTATKRKGE